MQALQLQVNLDLMTEAQRQFVAGFILGYPNSDGTVYEYADPVPPVLLCDDPTAAFGPVSMPLEPGTISYLGPSLVIPALPSEAGTPPAPPTPPVPAPPPSGTGATLDSKGLPWDGRIHASGKSLNSDGTWRKKRAVSDVLVHQVETELRALMAIPSPTAATTAVSPSVPPPPPVAQVLPPPPPTPINEPEMRQLYVTLIGRTSAAMASKKLSEDQLNKCLAAVGVASVPSLGIRLDLVPTVLNMIDGIIAGQTVNA